MTKKVGLAAATPDDENRYSLKAEHDYLTSRLGGRPVLAIVELAVTEAGGHDEQGNQITKVRIRHLEHARTDAGTEKVEALFTELHHERTGNAHRPSDDGGDDTAAELEGIDDTVED